MIQRNFTSRTAVVLAGHGGDLFLDEVFKAVLKVWPDGPQGEKYLNEPARIHVMDGVKFGAFAPEDGVVPVYGFVFANRYLKEEEVKELAEAEYNRVLEEMLA
jgi:hypothetical protein